MLRREVIASIASAIPIFDDSCTLVGIDGRDGAGKTQFADELADHCARGFSRDVIRISIDDFHHTKSMRYRRGKQSPEGYWLDSYDYDSFLARVATPLGRGGSRRYRKRGHDLTSDAILEDEHFHEAAPGSIVIVDGIFLHRPELVALWHASVFLRVSAEICADRMLVRDGSRPELNTSDRYYGGQAIYLSTCNPEEKATIVVDNTSFDAPVVVSLLGPAVENHGIA
ncbi:uridine kinase family [Thozetella sp. PMI_491]|nr:uridine kinase family [Thozetella sp. PMI_491]